LKKLGKYEVLGELGHGAMGVVYRARDPVINRLVALKTITTGLAEDPNLLQRFYREAQSAGGLQHPNIVTIYDMGDEQNLPYIAMELIEGESLEQIIAHRTALPVALKLTYALQACRAFDYAHKRGIIHRDIKPGNVMVNKESVVKVVDFGIARVLDTSKTQTGMLIGTFAYMSPEQYHGEHADERSDIWSFGILLYELLCYQRPFTGENPASLMHSICQQDPRPLRELAPDCPPEMEAIISKLLRKSPQDRCQSMEDLLLELDPVYKELQTRSIAELIDRSRQLIDEGGFAQARELLRESLKVDSANTQARALLEKVNAELKRILIRPRAQQYVEKGNALLEEGRIQEARAEVENALQLDSTFGSAQELQKRIQHELDRAQVVAEWLQSCRQRLAEGMPDEAETFLEKVLEVDPSNKQVGVLQQQARTEKAERQRRFRLLEKMQEARGLWTQQNHKSSIELLSALQKEFPSEDEIQRLLETVQEDQAEQYRQSTLGRVRDFLASGSYVECRALLLELQQRFPNDDEASRLLEDVQANETKQRRLQRLMEVRDCLASGHYQDSIALLVSLEREFPDDEEIARLFKIAREDQAEQQRQQGIAEVRDLLAARHYEDCNALLAKLRKQFPNDDEIPELLKVVREDEAEQRKLKSLTEARNLLTARRYEQSIALLTKLGSEFAGEEEILRLLKSAREGQAEQQRQQGIAEVRNLLAARHYEDCNALLAKLRKQFPNDGEIPELLKAVRDDEAEQRKLKSLTEARNVLAARNYEQSIALLVSIEKEFPDDEEVLRLLKTAREEQSEQQRQQGIAEARNLLAARRYEDCNTLLGKLRKQFPNDDEIPELLNAVGEDEAEQRKLKSFTEAQNLLASRRYAESIALLTVLQKEFPKEAEIPRLLANACKEQAEQQKQQKLAEGRALLAAQKFNEALELLDTLRAAHSKDAAIEKLRAVVEREQEKLARGERLQRELNDLKKLVSQKKYSDILSRAVTLQAEFPGNADLLRLVDFARTQQSQIESETRLRSAIDEVKAHSRASRFTEAISAANLGLKAFPGNPELLYLREQAEPLQKKQRARGLIEQQIREIKFKINREKFSEAIALAKKTLATTGPDADLTQLLNSALVEFQTREKKRRQEQKLHEIRTMMQSGNIDQAAKTLYDAVATEALNGFDPRVNRISQEIEAAKSTSGAASPASMPSAPVNLSKEYAFLQGAPPEIEPSPPGEIGSAETTASQASTTQPGISSQPVVPMPPPKFAPIAPESVLPDVIPPAASEPTIVSQPAAPPSPPELVKISPERTVPAVIPRHQPAAGSVREPSRQISTSKVDRFQPRDLKKQAVIGALAVGLILAVWAGVHFISANKIKTTETGNPPVITQPSIPKTVAPNKPPADPIEMHQRSALDAADKLISSGDLKGALQVLQDAEKLNGPLTTEIKGKEANVSESMNNKALGDLRQEEAKLWQRATDEVRRSEFESAKRDLRKITNLGDGGVRKADAEKMLDNEIPRRQEEDVLFRQATQSAKGNDVETLQRAADLFGQVVALDGPRKAEAAGLQRSLQAKLASIKDENTRRQIAALEAAGRQNIQQGDFNGARQKADQIRQAGGDPTALSGDIDQAQASQTRLVQQQRRFQQAAQAYKAVSSSDKLGLEKSRSDFQTIARENSPQAADAQRYLTEIDKKLDALNTPPPPSPVVKKEPPDTAAADEAAIRDVVQRFFQAFDQRNPDELRQVWPSIPQKTYDRYKGSFENMSAIAIQIVSESVKISPDGATAIVSVQTQEAETPRSDKKPQRFSPSWTIQLTKRNGIWVITDV
jgi:eukaryotic-like serine/threonine-protein kinase